MYANPVIPNVCPILSLGIYFLSFPAISGNYVFPGGAQAERFRKRLHAVLARPPLSTLLDDQGVSANDLGTHSIRKGSATFCSSGSTACPSSSAVRVRAGWSTGAVHETYCLYEQAGDQHVGRTATGLPMDTPEFALLPPHFDPVDDEVRAALHALFPALSNVASAVALFCMASLLHHDDYLQATLAASHPLRQTHYFQNTALKQSLQRKIVYGAPSIDTTLRPTGVPPYVGMLVGMKEIVLELRAFARALERAPADVAAAVAEVGRDDAAITRTNLDSVVADAFRNTGIYEAIDRLNAMNTMPPLHPTVQFEPEDIVPIGPDRVLPLRVHNGRLTRLRVGFVLPKGTLLSAWQLWFCGNPPLRAIAPKELGSRAMEKRYNDLQFVMRKLHANVPQFPRTPSPTIAEANDAFVRASENFELLRVTPSGRVRRIDQVRWTSAATILRKAKVRQQS